MRRITTLAALAAAVLAGSLGMSKAMGPRTEVMQVACRVEGPKTRMPAHICNVFAERLEAAFPDRTVRQEQPADLVLVVEDSGPQSFTARIDQGDTPGTPLRTVRRDAPLDDAARARLLDSLIAGLTL